ncbi:hypothetical protein WA026_009318 [Henosepilachna vigintioctopunctata]|uniref:Activator 1 subunit 5 n=1 Tax=Henosepilachna vigintioctopunctata TaxID=420089 RepID=A0AAW1UYQ1_9CUCU
MVLELNASDDRGIGIVRGQILTFASTRTIFKSGFKLIILDEADAMTIDAQNALRRTSFSSSMESIPLTTARSNRVGWWSDHLANLKSDVNVKRRRFQRMRRRQIAAIALMHLEREYKDARNNYCSERRRAKKEYWTRFVESELSRIPWVVDYKIVIEKYTENIRFCIICNYLSKIIPAIQSRCTRFRFGPLSPQQILPRLNYVVDQESVKISEDGKQALLQLANGDMRKVLNVLQSTWLAYKDVTEDNVYSCVGHPLKKDIENIIKWLLNETFETSYKNIKTLKVLKGLALQDILTEVHRYIHRIEFPYEAIVPLLTKLAEIEYRLASGTNENIQLTALISSFQSVKNISPSV